jgi:hypothetical protein
MSTRTCCDCLVSWFKILDHDQEETAARALPNRTSAWREGQRLSPIDRPGSTRISGTHQEALRSVASAPMADPARRHPGIQALHIITTNNRHRSRGGTRRRTRAAKHAYYRTRAAARLLPTGFRSFSVVSSPQMVGLKYIYRRRAEAALGRKLRSPECVYHLGSAPDAPLVIVGSKADHLRLRALRRIRTAGGRPWIDKICGVCRKLKLHRAFSTATREWDRRCRACRRCEQARVIRFYRRRRTRAAPAARPGLSPDVQPECQQ